MATAAALSRCAAARAIARGAGTRMAAPSCLWKAAAGVQSPAPGVPRILQGAALTARGCIASCASFAASAVPRAPHGKTPLRRRGLPVRSFFATPVAPRYRHIDLSVNARYNYGRNNNSGNGVDPQVALTALLGTNVGVFLLWRASEAQLIVSPRFMADHFVRSAVNLEQGRYHTLLTCAFSHVSFWHLLANGACLYFFGGEIAMVFGGAALLRLYGLGAAAASAAHIAYFEHQHRNRRQSSPWGGIFGEPSRRRRSNYWHFPAAIGASGAVNAIIMFYTLTYPFRSIYVYGLIPVPAWMLGVLTLGRDFLDIGHADGTGPAAHLGGAALGAAAKLYQLYGSRMPRGRL